MIEFINITIGVGKAGTISPYYYLAQHPGLFMSPDKERRLFMLLGLDHDTTPAQRTDFLAAFANAVSALQDYVRLFRELRNGSEPHASLVEVLDRHGGRHFYSQGGYYAEQLERYERHAPDNPLCIWLYEDFASDPVRIVGEMFAYVGVDLAFVPHTGFPARVSGSAAPDNRWSQLYDWMRNTRLRSSPFARRLLSPKIKQKVVEFLAARADAGRVKARLCAAAWERLCAHYDDDLLRFQRLLGRDLARWRKCPG